MEGYNYNAAAGSRIVRIEDITKEETNREMLRKLEKNDPNFDKLWVRSSHDLAVGRAQYYLSDGAHELGWLGYFISKNTTLKELHLTSNIFGGAVLRTHMAGGYSNAIEPFCRGVNRNTSIQKIRFSGLNLSPPKLYPSGGGETFRLLYPFLRDNQNLSELEVEGCVFRSGTVRQLSSAVRNCSKSLTSVRIASIQMRDGEQLVAIIEALNVHPQLEQFVLISMDIGANERMALSKYLRRSNASTKLHTLNLSRNAFDDGGVNALADALCVNSNLRSLDLSCNRITARGCQSLATLLTNRNSNLETLYLGENNIGDEGALILANAS